MKLRIQLPTPARCLSLSLFLLGTAALSAKTAEDYFHGGAMSYLSNNIPQALEVVTNGLQVFPQDEKLQKLYELLNQQQQQQQQQDQQNQQDQNDQKDQQQDQQQKPDKPDKDQSDQQQPQDQQNQKDQNSKPQDKPDQKKDGNPSKPEEPEPNLKDQLAAHEMTPQEAKQLLDAQKNDEQVLIFQPQGEPKNRTKQLKDW